MNIVLQGLEYLIFSHYKLILALIILKSMESKYFCLYSVIGLQEYLKKEILKSNYKSENTTNHIGKCQYKCLL